MSRVKWRRVILESPCSGDVDLNVRFAHACVLDCIERCESPYASHLMLTTALDDTDSSERAMGMSAGQAWYASAEAVVVYQDLGISSGMRLGIEEAKRLGVPVEYRFLRTEAAK